MRTVAPEQTHELEGYINADTGKAVLVSVHCIDGHAQPDVKKDWFPLSQVKSMTKRGPQEEGYDKIVVSNWILRAKGLA